MTKLILIGAGGHAKSVADSISDSQVELCGFIDEHKTGTYLGKPVFGSDIRQVPDYRSYTYFVSIGDIQIRKLWFERIAELQLQTLNIIDSTALISPSARLGTGNFIGKMAVINADVVMGDNNVVNTRALIEHECRIGSHIHLSTNSVINGNVEVEDGVFFGSSATSNGQLRIGHDAVVGSGSVVIREVEPCTTVVGVPAHIIKRNGKSNKGMIEG